MSFFLPYFLLMMKSETFVGITSSLGAIRRICESFVAFIISLCLLKKAFYIDTMEVFVLLNNVIVNLGN